MKGPIDIPDGDLPLARGGKSHPDCENITPTGDSVGAKPSGLDPESATSDIESSKCGYYSRRIRHFGLEAYSRSFAASFGRYLEVGTTIGAIHGGRSLFGDRYGGFGRQVGVRGLDPPYLACGLSKCSGETVAIDIYPPPRYSPEGRRIATRPLYVR